MTSNTPLAHYPLSRAVVIRKKENRPEAADRGRS